MNEDEKKVAEELLERFQRETQQLESLLLQKQTLVLRKMEMEQAIEELEKNESKSAYKISGPIIIMKDKESLLKELKEGVEELDLQIKILEKNETKLRESINESGKKLQKLLPELKEE